MKKTLTLFITVTLAILLTGCDSVYIEPDTIGFQFENVRYADGSLFMDAYITNGYDTDEYITNLYLTVYTEDEEYMIADAYFEILESIPADNYYQYELEFYGESLLVDSSEFALLDYSLDDAIAYFEVD